MNEKEGIIMSSYSDNKFALFWKDLLDTKGEQGVNEELVRLLRESTGRTVDMPIKTHVFFWSCGVGYWGVGANSENISKNIIHPLNPYSGGGVGYDGEQKLDLFICGETFSWRNQQWMEGALETSNFVIDNLSL